MNSASDANAQGRSEAHDMHASKAEMNINDKTAGLIFRHKPFDFVQINGAQVEQSQTKIAEHIFGKATEGRVAKYESREMANRVPKNQLSGAGLFMNELESLGRTRGSSAIPVQSGHSMQSPQPQRDLQGPINQMNEQLRRAYLNDGSQSQSTMPRNQGNTQLQNQRANRLQRQHSTMSNKNQGGNYGSHTRDPSSSTQQSTSSQGTGHSSPSSGPGTCKFLASPGRPSASSTDHMNSDEKAQYFQAKLAEVQLMIPSRPDLSKTFQDQLTAAVQKIAQEFASTQRLARQEYEIVKGERDDLRRQLQAANDQALQERKQLELKHQKSLERMQQVESRWNYMQADLLKQIEFQKEQLDGKRALWMEANPGSSARRDAMKSTLRDPFQSPTAKLTNSYSASGLGSMASPSFQSPFPNSFGSQFGGPLQLNNLNAGYNITFQDTLGMKSSTERAFGGNNKASSSSRNRPPPANHQLSNLPTGISPSNGYTAPYSSANLQNYQRFSTESSYDRGNGSSTALVPFNDSERLAAEYKSAISQLYDLVEGWVLKYANVPNPQNDRAIASGNNILWDYMMNCAYPGNRQDSHTHIVALLSDRSARYWFIMRLAAQYCVKDVMSIEAFKPYSKNVERVITEMLEKLKERGLAIEARQIHIDRGTEAVKSVLTARDYASFRAEQLNVHTKALRDILGPTLNDDAVRAEAGKDLGAIVVHSWELCVKMHRGGYTFQIYFPETASKFTAATMNSKDRPNADKMQLQIQQVRVKLVITPVITMRDDKGTTIRAKALHQATVLLMG